MKTIKLLSITILLTIIVLGCGLTTEPVPAIEGIGIWAVIAAPIIVGFPIIALFMAIFIVWILLKLEEKST